MLSTAECCMKLKRIGVTEVQSCDSYQSSLLFTAMNVCAPQKCVWMRTHVRKSRVMSLCISQICEKIRVFIVVKYRIEDGTLQCSITQNKQKAALVTKI